MSPLEQRLHYAKEASFKMAGLSELERNGVLEKFSQNIESHISYLLEENKKDLKIQKNKISESLYQRLKLDSYKILQLVQGIRDLVKIKDPLNVVRSKKKLDENLILECKSVPLGVLAVIFESRPDVLPQIVSLAIKSGNALLLKGGQEAYHSLHGFMKIIQSIDGLPNYWIQLIDSRQEMRKFLVYPQYIDLVIPRGSNQLVRSILEESLIPVLGHADGVCHIYVHESLNKDTFIPIVMDAKTQYPAACNAVETLLIDKSLDLLLLKELVSEGLKRGIKFKGCPWIRSFFPSLEEVSEWHCEYGDLTLAIKGVDSYMSAIEHINTYGSHHTDALLASDPLVIEVFQRQVDSACVFINCSTRFSDGYRFGMGAEVGISTSKTHARGPVGLEGLVSYKYILSGSGQIVSSYVGDQAKKFLHIEVSEN